MYDDLQLTPQANNVLAPLFKNNFDFDISKVTFKFGWTGVAHAITISNTVTLNQGKWNKLTPGQQRKLLAHEVTHAVQYERLNPGGGVFRGVGLPMAIMSFLGRYTPSYIILSHKDNYVPDVDLKREPLSTLDVLDTRWTLDQIAEHVADQVQ